MAAKSAPAVQRRGEVGREAIPPCRREEAGICPVIHLLSSRVHMNEREHECLFLITEIRPRSAMGRLVQHGVGELKCESGDGL